jgi:hypothetical protein
MKDIYFTTQQEFNTALPVSRNLDVNWWKPAMINAQYQDLKPCLGDGLFYEIESQIDTGTITVANEALRLELVRAVANFTMYHYGYIGGVWRHENIGNKANADPTVTDPNSTESAHLRNEYRNYGETWRQLAIDFINKNITNYPLYERFIKDSCGCGDKGCGTFGGIQPYKKRNRGGSAWNRD